MKKSKRPLFLFLSICLLLSCLAPMAYAAIFDGAGSGSGTSSGFATGSTYVQSTTNPRENIVGYRFSCYNGDGTKTGHSIDVLLDAEAKEKRYRSEAGKSHVDLYHECREGVGWGKVSIAPLKNNLTAYDESLLPNVADKRDCVAVGQGLLVGSNAINIAKECGAKDFSMDGGRIVMEPLIKSVIGGNRYALTLAEYAVFQAREFGSWGHKNPDHTTGYVDIANYMSANFLLLLYSKNNYTGWLTEGVNPDWVTETRIELPDPESWTSGGVNHLRNRADQILRYQAGMGVFTTNSRIRFRVEDPNGNPVQGYWGKLFWWGNKDVTQGYSDVNGEIGRLSVDTTQKKRFL